ncbi:bMERB domain-containing protein 1-like isoform X3 [Pipra filicauda]|uniref:BMERB domain-containing protein 1-like isoform X3 n=1 Tax=Pipra filicauda TaxID=649802 RepID=A0A6J2IDQ5_9PASS|nr:bMERB domain-containing protein 1-like isoform X3 [Pipra filicauda]
MSDCIQCVQFKLSPRQIWLLMVKVILQNMQLKNRLKYLQVHFLCSGEQPKREDEIVSMADSTTTIDDIEGELFKIERIREILVRRESELRYMMDDIQLCKEISRLKKELQKLIALPENEKSNEEKQREEELVQQIHKLVETRDFLVDDVEFERLREREEDKEMAEFLQSKLSKSYLQKATPVKEKKMTSRGQQTSAPYMTKTGLTLLKECCGFTCSIM